MAEGSCKRQRGSPTGHTPMQVLKKRTAHRKSSAAKKSLEFSSRSPFIPLTAWSNNETKALLEFVLFHGTDWPVTKDPAFWDSASKFIRDRVNDQPLVRSGK